MPQHIQTWIHITNLILSEKKVKASILYDSVYTKFTRKLLSVGRKEHSGYLWGGESSDGEGFKADFWRSKILFFGPEHGYTVMFSLWNCIELNTCDCVHYNVYAIHH